MHSNDNNSKLIDRWVPMGTCYEVRLSVRSRWGSTCLECQSYD